MSRSNAVTPGRHRSPSRGREADHLRLAEIRKRVGRSQAEIAHSMGTTQSAVSRLERQDDLRVSTLRDYATALGGRLRISIVLSDHELDVHRAQAEYHAWRTVFERATTGVTL